LSSKVSDIVDARCNHESCYILTYFVLE